MGDHHLLGTVEGGDGHLMRPNSAWIFSLTVAVRSWGGQFISNNNQIPKVILCVGHVVTASYRVGFGH